MRSALAGQWQQMLALDRQRPADGLLATIDDTCFIFTAAVGRSNLRSTRVTPLLEEARA